MKIIATIEIPCEPERVFPWINDPDKAMRWQKGVKSGEIIKETPQRIGTTFKEVMEEDGKSLEMYGVITDFIQDKSISFHLESKIHKVDVNYLVSGAGDKSEVIEESTITWKFPMNLISLINGKKIKNSILKQTNSELGELKVLCETEKNIARL